jgi:hypothetical protein
MTSKEVMKAVRDMKLTTDQKNAICGWIGRIVISDMSDVSVEKTPPEIIVTNTPSKIVVSKYKAGDVLMHGPLRHPVMLISKSHDKNSWIGVLLTSEEKCKDIMMPINYRIHPRDMNSFVTKTLLSVKSLDSYSYKYTINDKKIIKKIKKIIKKELRIGK